MTLTVNISNSKVVARFWSYVDRKGDDDCWEWKATKVRSGHGQLWDGVRNVAAHRFSLALHGAKIDGHLVCHRCNNPGCVNPRHLYAGTHADNMQDCINAGTHKPHPAPRGEANYRAVLTEEIVSEIKRIYRPRQPGVSGRALARRFGVTQNSISKIMRGETWTHV